VRFILFAHTFNEHEKSDNDYNYNVIENNLNTQLFSFRGKFIFIRNCVCLFILSVTIIFNHCFNVIYCWNVNFTISSFTSICKHLFVLLFLFLKF